MNGVIFIALASLSVVALGLMLLRLYREIFFFEGIRLGSRIHQWLYNRWAVAYDADKIKVQKDDSAMLACPMIERLASCGEDRPETLVLDVATGTGRLASVLLSDEHFSGRVIGLDTSAGMLQQAAEKLAVFGSRSVLLNQPAMPLPFPDCSFDAVSCLETLELLPDPEAHLREFLRVMKPGGILLVSRNTGEWGIRGRCSSPAEFCALVDAAGFEQTELTPWWKWFDLVWARRPAR